MASIEELRRLTERQRQILRLLLAGHDAKSAARHLGISHHTVHEHLREARRQLSVSTSREAARVLGRIEGSTPKEMGDSTLGVAESTKRGPTASTSDLYRRTVYAGAGIMIVFLAAAAGVLIGQGGAARQGASDGVPHIVATTPRVGEVINPGRFTLSATFDRPMRADSYSFVQVSLDSFPACDRRPQLSANGRTFALRCTAAAGRNYEVWFNREPYMNFTSLNGVAAQPYRLTFSARH